MPEDNLLFGNGRHKIKSIPCRDCCSAEVLWGKARELLVRLPPLLPSPGQWPRWVLEEQGEQESIHRAAQPQVCREARFLMFSTQHNPEHQLSSTSQGRTLIPIPSTAPQWQLESWTIHNLPWCQQKGLKQLQSRTGGTNLSPAQRTHP